MRNSGLMQTTKFVALGFIIDKVSESIMFSMLRLTNIFIADLLYDLVTARSITNSIKGKFSLQALCSVKSMKNIRFLII